MAKSQELIYLLNRKIDRLNTEFKKAKRIVDMCSALTEAQDYLIKDRLQKAEQDKRFRHELLPLEVKEKRVLTVSGTTETIIPFPEDYLRDLGIRIIASKRGCRDKEIALTKMDTDDKAKSLNNPFWKSSFGWEQVFGDEGADGIHVYNGTDFTVLGMVIDYYKKPFEIHCPSQVVPPDEYIDWNGIKRTEDTVWLLDELKKEGVNLAAQILKGDIGDFRDFQLQANSNMQTEQISKL